MKSMKYADLLREYIEKSGLTLDEISERCERRSVVIHPTYISKLRLGQRPAPKEPIISEVLAKVTGGDPDALVRAAQMERIPEDIKDILVTLVDFLGPDVYMEARKVAEENPGISEWSKEELRNVEGRQKVLDAVERRMDDPEFHSHAEKTFLSLQRQIGKSILDIQPFDLDGHRMVPVIGGISAGDPALAVEEIIDYEMVPERIVRGGDYFFLVVKGDSMTGARIFEGDRVLVRLQESLENGQIGVLLVNDDEATIKRFYQEGQQCILVAENPAYKPQIYPANEVRVIGEVIEVRFKLNGRK